MRAYEPFAGRAQLYRNMSLSVVNEIQGTFDLVFIDGPHTYANVRQDILAWQPKVRPGGIVSGHDFMCGHPPLLWAVSEQHLAEEIHVAMDGVWWWTA